jgi:hypothetical protein
MDGEFNDGGPMLPRQYHNNPNYTQIYDLQKDLDAFREHFRYYFCDLDGPSTAIIVQHAL